MVVVTKVATVEMVVVLASLVLVFEQTYLQVDVMNLKYLRPTLGPLNR